MSQKPGRVAMAFAAAFGTLLGLLLPSVGGAGPDGSLLLVTVVVAVLLAASSVDGRLSALPSLALALQLCTRGRVRSLGTDLATDPVHSPLRPRAPGLV